MFTSIFCFRLKQSPGTKSLLYSGAAKKFAETAEEMGISPPSLVHGYMPDWEVDLMVAVRTVSRETPLKKKLNEFDAVTQSLRSVVQPSDVLKIRGLMEEINELTIELITKPISFPSNCLDNFSLDSAHARNVENCLRCMEPFREIYDDKIDNLITTNIHFLQACNNLDSELKAKANSKLKAAVGWLKTDPSTRAKKLFSDFLKNLEGAKNEIKAYNEKWQILGKFLMKCGASLCDQPASKQNGHPKLYNI